MMPVSVCPSEFTRMQVEVGSHLPNPPPVSGKRIGIVVSRFNGEVTTEILMGCQDALTELGVTSVDVYWVPGSWELPQACRRIAARNLHDAIITIGCVIRGQTPHFDVVSSEVSRGLGAVARTIEIPLLFGVLTTDTQEQAWTRASRELGNKGLNLAWSALHMIALYETLED